MASSTPDAPRTPSTPLSPGAALAEIAFRLERELAPTFKVKAFRRAAAALAGYSDADLADRAADGSLRRVKGIGDSSFTVVKQASEGVVPDYLQKLRDRAEPGSGPGDAVEGLAASLRGDLHTHSEWSDGTVPIELMVEAAGMLGREYLAITDHSPNLTIANGLSADRLEQQLALVAALDAAALAAGPPPSRHIAAREDAPRDDSAREPAAAASGALAPTRVLSGIEVDILESGALDQQPELLARLDIVVASVHSKLRADRATMTKRMLAAIENPRVNILAHCTGRLVQGSRGTRPPSEFDTAAVFAACAANEVAVEINCRPERQDPPDDLIAQALDAGCLFSIDSDAHAPGHLGFLPLGAARAAAAGIPPARIITTWPRATLLAWARP